LERSHEKGLSGFAEKAEKQIFHRAVAANGLGKCEMGKGATMSPWRMKV
jgi:hypothetical protein